MDETKHENLIKELRESVISKARHEKRQRQHIFFVLPFGLLTLIMMLFAISFSTMSSGVEKFNFFVISVDLGIFLRMAIILFVLVAMTFSYFSPFGKISEEKVQKLFREELFRRIESRQQEIAETEEKLPKLQEELKMLNEVEIQYYDFRS